VLARVRELRDAGRDVINLGIGEPGFPIAPHILEAAARAVRDGPHGYTEAAGLPALRDAVAARHAREGYEVDPEDVLILPGAKVGLLFAALAFGQPGGEILFPDPGFPIYRSVAALSGATPVAYPLFAEHGFGLRAEDLLSRITERTRMLILNSPGNPTGGVHREAELEILRAGLLEHPELAVVSDEIYRPLYFSAHPPPSLLAFADLRSRLIVIDGWSKAYAMTGWRLGYSIWPEHLRELALRLAVNNHSCVNTVAQAAGLAALEGPQESVAQMRAALRRRRALILEHLAAAPGVRCPEPLGAFYAFPDVRGTGRSADVLQRELLEDAGVATLAGSGFGDEGREHLRLSFAASEEELAEAGHRIAAHLG
jgi:aspartate/methionine/tyrosine aminotransferase